LIRERVHAGIKAAKKAGKVLGRPKRIFDRSEVHALRRQGRSIREISRRLNVGMGSVTSTLAEAA
jgi:putative DNA-invertase from lambdoid prophage Rac